ncbi:Crp/Fnr family transcriptional regulator [Algoriphagus boritolerans]|uniref:cAMP-binding domain of CRP or a regulatory subunit of cAMP-dependent protein kinases n=1 Tax=Algoriphagus boritolerans DSM 17298 = JCM 18970 TaxID=1120964 RepID=A0A1H5RT50_9BACT|nr:Crp/Fnr family transcriptional regulator [Algoriphagus boritolerans]SEF40671.1 cAMP-binding domain of CRP or a regulatory subunit of cAMP-dependent protein kinases [Algoriphagus boritolerans DSM 17298 = JCM 18970]
MNDLDSFLNFLCKIQPLSPEGQDAILSLCSQVPIAKNQNLQDIGQKCHTIYFVKEGLARIFYLKDGIEVTEYFAFENDLIIRAESLFRDKPSTKAIQALENTVFIGIPAEALFSLFDQFAEIERLFRKIIEQAYVNTVIRMEAIQFHPAEERYAQLLAEKPNLIQRISLKHIASYLGITQVSLSRIRAAVR